MYTLKSGKRATCLALPATDVRQKLELLETACLESLDESSPTVDSALFSFSF